MWASRAEVGKLNAADFHEDSTHAHAHTHQELSSLWRRFCALVGARSALLPSPPNDPGPLAEFSQSLSCVDARPVLSQWLSVLRGDSKQTNGDRSVRDQPCGRRGHQWVGREPGQSRLASEPRSWELCEPPGPLRGREPGPEPRALL